MTDPHLPTMSMHLTADDCDAATREQLITALELIEHLKADLLEVREYLEGQMDVVDGSYGQPEPNRAMQLVNLIDERIHGAGNFR